MQNCVWCLQYHESYGILNSTVIIFCYLLASTSQWLCRHSTRHYFRERYNSRLRLLFVIKRRGRKEVRPRARFLKRRPGLKRVARLFCPGVNRPYMSVALALLHWITERNYAESWRARIDHFVVHVWQWASERRFINRSIKAACASAGIPSRYSSDENGCHRDSLLVYTRRGT